jgi:hypothetical protein
MVVIERRGNKTRVRSYVGEDEMRTCFVASLERMLKANKEVHGSMAGKAYDAAIRSIKARAQVRAPL